MTVTNLFRCITLAGLICFTSYTAIGQKIALLDTKLKAPIVYTDSVSVGQAAKGYIAVPSVDLDTLYSNLVYLKNILGKRQRSKMQSFQLLTNSTQIDVSRVPMAYGDRYLIALISKNGQVSTRMTLSNGELSNKKVAAKAAKILSYMSSNNSLFSPPKEIHPRIYNIVVISDR